MSEEFVGDVQKIASSKLIESPQDEIGIFFLTLAVIYNDLKGLVLLNRLFENNYDMPTVNVISPHVGEYNGMLSQLFKLLAGMINEFFVFLKEHEKLYSDPEFMRVILKMPKSVQQQWHEVLSAALERTESKQGLGFKLMHIRNNVAFHYYQSEKVLLRSYREFFKDKTMFGADYAYYASGHNMPETRFYYADAAVQRYLMQTASRQPGTEFTQDLIDFREFQSETFQLVRTMNMLLANMLHQFISIRSAK